MDRLIHDVPDFEEGSVDLLICSECSFVLPNSIAGCESLAKEERKESERSRDVQLSDCELYNESNTGQLLREEDRARRGFRLTLCCLVIFSNPFAFLKRNGGCLTSPSSFSLSSFSLSSFSSSTFSSFLSISASDVGAESDCISPEKVDSN